MLSLAMAAGLTNAAITPIASASDRYGTIAVSCRPQSTARPAPIPAPNRSETAKIVRRGRLSASTPAGRENNSIGMNSTRPIRPRSSVLWCSV